MLVLEGSIGLLVVLLLHEHPGLHIGAPLQPSTQGEGEGEGEGEVRSLPHPCRLAPLFDSPPSCQAQAVDSHCWNPCGGTASPCLQHTHTRFLDSAHQPVPLWPYVCVGHLVNSRCTCMK